MTSVKVLQLPVTKHAIIFRVLMMVMKILPNHIYVIIWLQLAIVVVTVILVIVTFLSRGQPLKKGISED